MHSNCATGPGTWTVDATNQRLTQTTNVGGCARYIYPAAVAHHKWDRAMPDAARESSAFLVPALVRASLILPASLFVVDSIRRCCCAW